MTYDAILSSNIPLVTLEFINYAIDKYEYIKDINKNLDEDDYIDLSFLFISLISNTFKSFESIKSILNKHGINYGLITNNYKMHIIDLRQTKEKNKEYIYNYKFKDYINYMLINKNIYISELYPEDILIDMIECNFCNNLLYDLGISNENKRLLISELINNKINRISEKINMDYNNIRESKLPTETKILLINSLHEYNRFFNLHDYNKAIFIKEEYKIIFALMYTIIRHLYYKDFLKNYNLNEYDTLRIYEMLYKYEYNSIELDELEKRILYNEKFKNFISNMLSNSDIFKELEYDLECMYPESLFIAVGFDNSFANNFYKILGFNDNDIINLKKDFHVSLKKSILGRDINNKYNHPKYFNISDYVSNNNYKRLDDKVYDDEDIIENSTFEFVKTRDISKNNHKDYSVLKKYGYFLDEKDYITNPAIGRELEIRKVILSFF